MDRPDKKTVERYLAGTLSEKEHATIELWLDQQEESMITTVLNEAAENVANVTGIGESAEIDLKDQFYFTPDFRMDRYRCQSKLGAGGMGVVELADDLSLVRSVAVKRCRPRGYNEDVRSFKQRQQLFQREAEIIGGLEHPGIIPIHEIGIDAYGNPAMVMKALSGQNFEEWRNQELEQHSQLDIAEGLRIIVKIADALAYAHEHGVVHRDIKVDNIVIGEHGAVTVIDWGLAVKVKQELIQQEHAFEANVTGAYGTPSWMAPEQAMAVSADPRMDVWGIGGLLLFLYTGSDPRPDVEAKENIRVEDIIKPISLPKERLKGIPPGLQAVIKRCLNEDPVNRYNNCSEVATELRQWLTEGVTRAQEPGVILRTIACIRKYPIPASIIITVLLALLVLSVSEWVRYQKQMQLIENLANDLITQTDMSSIGEVVSARKQLQTLEQRYGKDRLSFHRAQQRLESAHDVLVKYQKLNTLEQALKELDQKFRITGPWKGEVEDRRKVHGLSGLDWSHLDRDSIDAHKKHPLSDQLLKNLVHLQVASLISDKSHAYHDHDDHKPLNNYIAAVGLGKSWDSMSKVFEQATVSAHEVVLESDNGTPIDVQLIDACLKDPKVGDLLLALSKPNDQLIKYAHARWRAEPDSFWPCVIIARHALVKGDLTKSRIHALIALGQEGKSIWPQLSLAYIEMLSDNIVQSQVWIGNILRNHPDHLETRILRSVVLLKSGNKDAAQKEVDLLSAWSHFHIHEEHGGGHPMDISLELLKKGNVRLHSVDRH